MKHIVAGIVAHVDAGKTTLSEALLYRGGTLRQVGRVDKGDAFLDTDALEKRRGITIFAHQAQLQTADLALTLLDTPGHVDFASQTEQVLSALDYAILVVSATDGVQGYTRTLWRLLQRYAVPTFIFVNKMDAPDVDRQQILAELQTKLAEGCVAFTGAALPAGAAEDIALQDAAALDEFSATDTLADDTVRRLVHQRLVFPVYFGAALKLSGVADFLAGFTHWTTEKTWPQDFAARVFKISHDDKGERLSWLRVTGGSLHTKDVLHAGEKANQLRVYNGAKFDVVPEVPAGAVCAVTGLTQTYPGCGLGAEADAQKPVLQPVLNYAVDLQGQDLHEVLAALRQLEDEDPQLHVQWSEHLQELRVQLMGAVQLEVLQQLLQERYQLQVGFDQGSILYKETITAPIEGVGHFEPLRHYAEVHLLLEPVAPSSGLMFAADCPLEVLGRNWQHQVLTSLGAKEQLGVLTGAPLTDVKVTLVTGRASNVHSVGGDFREATWRALRQGLMELATRNACQLLEPWYQFTLTVDQTQVGRALTDIQRMHGTFAEPVAAGGQLQISGTAPVATMRDYAAEVAAYTHGQGQLDCVVASYQPAHDAAAVIAAKAYQPVADLDNTPDSVFCAHGAGYPVAWRDVPGMAHCEYVHKLS
ncbi:GTP-binding protein [Lacticaseibacillus zhaodongensis]|uniref:GTP-binding protein n=1 Tax=Lacticaseibacillus zhaodongensis TaxID=2668065 RepID=UPI0012D2E2C8|nr:GTP-binding protein [Lacticaseibacillus zhaodongensis]